MSCESRQEYIRIQRRRYRRAGKPYKTRLLDEVCAVWGYERKYAIKVLNGALGHSQGKRGRKSEYDDPELLKALQTTWLKSGQMCSKRLGPALPVWEEGLETQRVEKDPLPLLGGIQNWPLLFPRFDQPHADCTVLVPREPATLVFPWETEVPANTVLRRLGQILHQPLDAQYPAVDTLNHPRSLLLKGTREGFLLAMPPPSNLKNLSITLARHSPPRC